MLFRSRNCERVATMNLLPALDSGLKQEGRKRRWNWVNGRWEDMIYQLCLPHDAGLEFVLSTPTPRWRAHSRRRVARVPLHTPVRSINDPEYTEVVNDIGESSNDPIYLPMLANTFDRKDAIHSLYLSHVLADPQTGCRRRLSISLRSRQRRIRVIFFNGASRETVEDDVRVVEFLNGGVFRSAR